MFLVTLPKGGASAPPVVTTSPVSRLPVLGTILEFGRSPVKMVARCHAEYGPVFTVPVSRAERRAFRRRGAALGANTSFIVFVAFGRAASAL